MSTMENTTMIKENSGRTEKKLNVRNMTVTAMLSAIAYILMFLDTSIPIMPSFIKLDLSELPALIASFALGPVYGVIVCLIKNLFSLIGTQTGGVGELANFIIGASFVLTAGIIYHTKKTKKRAIIGSIIGAVVMGLITFPAGVYIIYPFYYNFMPKETIISMYQAIAPGLNLDSIEKCLLIFNVPFTFVKGMLSAIITIFIYQPLRPLLKGRN